MPRILKKDLLAENERLRQKLARYESCRSSAAKKPLPSAASTLQALNLVCKMERDPVIQEQRETIARQQKEIESLRGGSGPIGDVTLAYWRREQPQLVDEAMVARCKSHSTPVIDVLNNIRKHSDTVSEYCLFGKPSYPRNYTELPR